MHFAVMTGNSLLRMTLTSRAQQAEPKNWLLIEARAWAGSAKGDGLCENGGRWIGPPTRVLKHSRRVRMVQTPLESALTRCVFRRLRNCARRVGGPLQRLCRPRSFRTPWVAVAVGLNWETTQSIVMSGYRPGNIARCVCPAGLLACTTRCGAKTSFSRRTSVSPVFDNSRDPGAVTVHAAVGSA